MTPSMIQTVIEAVQAGGSGVTVLVLLAGFIWLAKKVPAIVKAITENAIATDHSADALEHSTKALEKTIEVIERLEAKLNV